MSKIKFELVRTITSDNLQLSGLFYESPITKTMCIFIHGFQGDFYSRSFIEKIVQKISVENKDCSFMSVQNRGTGIQSEILNSDYSESKLIGSNYELLEEAHLDISAWIKFAIQKGYTDFVLIGHSLGTLKAVRYLFEGEYSKLITKLILLSPYDVNGFLEAKFPNGKWRELVQKAKRMIESGLGTELTTEDYEDDVVSYQTYYSWYNESELNTIWDFYNKANSKSKVLEKINIPVKIIIGENDEFFYLKSLNTLDEVKTYLKNNIRNLELMMIENGEHCFETTEEELADEVTKFL
jgi:pimeloyl-ACP methyl ester carboxylesterase